MKMLQSCPVVISVLSRLRLTLVKGTRFYSTRKKTRNERITEEDQFAHYAISRLNQEFHFLNKQVTKAVDLGYAPGNWLQYIQHCLLLAHHVEPQKLFTKCTVVGVDMLFSQAPLGTYSIQGNIFSQNTHANILDLLKKRSYLLLGAKTPHEKSSPVAEKLTIEDDIAIVTNKVDSLDLDDQLAYFDIDVDLAVYQADLVTSDLSAAYLQRGGYYNNTMSRPFMRVRENELLRQPLTNPHKAHLDLADAAMLFCCEGLSKCGTFVLRLADVNMADPELALLEGRLRKMFQSVDRWYSKHLGLRHNATELYLVCMDKKNLRVDKYDLFDVQRVHA